MTAKIDKILTLIFSLIWAALIFIDYWYYHPGYALAMEYFQYTDTVVILSIVGLGAFFGVKKLREHKRLPFLSGGSGMIMLFMLIAGIILWTHYPKISGQSVEFFNAIKYLGKIGYILFGCYFVFSTCYVLGDIFVNKLFSFSFDQRESMIVKLALGIILLSIALLLLGIFSLLRFFVVFPLLLGILGLRWRQALVFWKATLLSSLDGKKPVKLDWVYQFFRVINIH